jgi:Spy/CpxP family protein refolding chaperone
MKRTCYLLLAVSAVMMSLNAAALAQPGGGFGGRGFGGGGSLLDLARIEAVQKEIEVVDDQLTAINKLADELRAQRDSQQGERPDFRNMSEEQRDKLFAEMRARREKESLAANAKLAEILLPPQITRLEEISLQQRGTSALGDPKVAEKLGLSADQKKKLEETMTANMESMRSKMQELFQGGNRDGIREKMQELRKEADEKVLAALTADQKAKFESLKGQPFQMPEGAFGRGRGGDRGGDRGGRGGDQGGRGGDRGGSRPQ